MIELFLFGANKRLAIELDVQCINAPKGCERDACDNSVDNNTHRQGVVEEWIGDWMEVSIEH